MKKKELLIILLLILLTLPSIFPLLHHGFFQTDDGEWMIIRFSSFYQSLHDGQFPVRFLQRLNFGYGYPVAEFLYPGSFYFASFMHIIRFGFVNSIKIVYLVSLIGSAVFSYLWLSRLFSKSASFIGALFTLYVPYHLYDVYTRGSVEVFALLWVPFILWQLERESIFWCAVGIGLLLISHNTMALLFLPLVFIYALLGKKFSFRELIISFISGLFLSAFFIIPAIVELPDTVFSQTSVSNPLLYFASIQLIGLSTLVVIVASAVNLVLQSKVNKHQRSLVIFFFVVSLVSIFLSLPVSSLLWNLPQASLIQFPFRVLSYFVVSIGFLATYIVSTNHKRIRWFSIIVLLGILCYSALPYSEPKTYFDKGEGYYYTNDATTTVKDEYMPLWVIQKPLNRPDQQVVVAKGAGQITNISTKSNSVIFSVSMQKAASIQLNTLYWPGWKVTIDGSTVSPSYNNSQGVMKITVPKGNHRVNSSFGENSMRLLADLLSLATFIGLVFFVRKKTKGQSNKS